MKQHTMNGFTLMGLTITILGSVTLQSNVYWKWVGIFCALGLFVLGIAEFMSKK